jgi:streptogramin lyase
MKKASLTHLLVFLSCAWLQAQPFAIGSWREHLPYLNGRSVVIGNNQVYCGTDEGLFSYRKSDQSLQRYSRLNGLNDFGINAIAYSSSYGVLVVAYENTNIDLLFDDGQVVNLSDIKRKNIPGLKVINSLYIDGRLCYISAGFGIVVLDLERREIRDTYYIGNGGSDLNVSGITKGSNFLFAATVDGVYQANASDPNLSNFNAWTKILSDTNNAGNYTMPVWINNRLIVNYDRPAGDTLFAWDGSWGASLPPLLQATRNYLNLRLINNSLLVTLNDSLIRFSEDLNSFSAITGSLIPDPAFRDYTEEGDGTIWVAEKGKGMLRIASSQWERFLPDGPNSVAIASMKSANGLMWLVHGPRNRSWVNKFESLGFSVFDGSNWVTWDGPNEKTPLFSQYNFYDNMILAVNPANRNRAYIASGGSGLIDFENGNVIKYYRDTNSTLLGQFGNPGAVKVHGIAYDADVNLWVSNAGVNSVVNVLTNNGRWFRYTFPGLINNSAKTGDMLVDRSGNIWTMIFENIGGKDGILFFNPNRTPDNPTDDQSAIAEFGSNRVRCMTEDKDGTIWVGTEQGVYLLFPPSVVPQQILIRQDNSLQYLLSGEVVTAIAVDGANRKWIGTETGGVFLFSSDGQQEIQHFTVDNSPLFSNNITAIGINDRTGEVFIGTEKGLLSYQGDAIEGGAEPGCSDLVVYPNPVRREYDGPVAIKGVVPNGTIKITDVNGGLVYQARSLGIQAVWDGRNLSGEKVSTGVYIVYSTDDLGENNCVTKLMYFR